MAHKTIRNIQTLCGRAFIALTVVFALHGFWFLAGDDRTLGIVGERIERDSRTIVEVLTHQDTAHALLIDTANLGDLRPGAVVLGVGEQIGDPSISVIDTDKVATLQLTSDWLSALVSALPDSLRNALLAATALAMIFAAAFTLRIGVSLGFAALTVTSLWTLMHHSGNAETPVTVLANQPVMAALGLMAMAVALIGSGRGAGQIAVRAIAAAAAGWVALIHNVSLPGVDTAYPAAAVAALAVFAAPKLMAGVGAAWIFSKIFAFPADMMPWIGAICCAAVLLVELRLGLVRLRKRTRIIQVVAQQDQPGTA